MVHADGFARQGAQAGDAPADPAPGLWWRRMFRGEEHELRRLRRWLTGLLPDRPARDDLLSVAVELGTNAIQHTASGQGGWFTVEVTWRGPVVRVSVTDGGAPGGPCLTNDPMSDCGRGLVIVRALSVRTGVSGGEHGRAVWAEIPWSPAPPVATPSGHVIPVAQPAPDGGFGPCGQAAGHGHATSNGHTPSNGQAGQNGHTGQNGRMSPDDSDHPYPASASPN